MGYTYKRKIEKRLSLMDKKLDELRALISEMKTDQQKVNSISDKLSTETDSLQKAVDENTPK